jgi:mRNA interferase MazF
MKTIAISIDEPTLAAGARGSRGAKRAANDDVSTVICAPIYSQILGLSTEVVVGPEEGIPKPSAARCDFLMLLAKAKLTSFAGSLTTSRVASLDRALSIAVGLR